LFGCELELEWFSCWLRLIKGWWRRKRMWGGWHSVSLVMGFFFQQKNKTKGAIDFGLCGW
jgi:hypothetical protein